MFFKNNLPESSDDGLVFKFLTPGYVVSAGEEVSPASPKQVQL